MMNLIFTWELAGIYQCYPFKNCLAFGFQVAIKWRQMLPETNKPNINTWDEAAWKPNSFQRTLPQLSWTVQNMHVSLHSVLFFSVKKNKTCSWGSQNSHGQVWPPMFFKTPPRYPPRRKIAFFKPKGLRPTLPLAQELLRRGRKCLDQQIWTWKVSSWNLPSHQAFQAFVWTKVTYFFQNGGPRIAWFCCLRVSSW